MAEFVAETCLTCKVRFGMLAETMTSLRQSQRNFHCPWGHSMFYPQGPAEVDQLRLERDRLKQEAARLEDEKRIAWLTANDQRERAAAAERRASAARGQVTKLRNRAAAGVCPCCNRTFVQLQRHMAAKHPTFKTEEISEGVTVQ